MHRELQQVQDEYEHLLKELSSLEARVLLLNEEKESLFLSMKEAEIPILQIKTKIQLADRKIAENEEIIQQKEQQRKEMQDLEVRSFLVTYQYDILPRVMLERYDQNHIIDPTVQAYKVMQMCYEMLYKIKKRELISTSELQSMVDIYKTFNLTEEHADKVIRLNLDVFNEDSRRHLTTELKYVIEWCVKSIVKYYKREKTSIQWFIELCSILKSRYVSLTTIYEWFGPMDSKFFPLVEKAIQLYKQVDLELQQKEETYEAEFKTKNVTGNKKRLLNYLLESIDILRYDKKIMLENFLKNIEVRDEDEFIQNMMDVSYLESDVENYMSAS
jgi:hypothetical protein